MTSSSLPPPTGEEAPQQPQPSLTADCKRCASYLASALLGTSPSSSFEMNGPGRLLRAMGATASMVDFGSGGSGSGGASAEAVVTIPTRRRSLASAAAAAASARSSPQQREESSAAFAAAAGTMPPPAAAGKVPRATDVRTEAAVAGEPEIVEKEIDDGGAAANSSGLLSTLRRRITSSAAEVFDPVLEQPTAAAVATSAAISTQSLSKNSDSDDSDSDDGPISVSITCQPCGTTGPEGGARAYVKGPHPLSVVLCSNRLRSPHEVNEVLVHELLHVYDVRVRNFDLRDCAQLAYSEVRAAREAECAGSLTKFTERMCVRERARVATNNMFPGKMGSDCVADVFERAMEDRAPFFGSGAGTGSDRMPDGAWGSCGFGGGGAFRDGKDGAASSSSGGSSKSSNGRNGGSSAREASSGSGAAAVAGGREDDVAVSSRTDGRGGSIFGRTYSSSYSSSQ